MVFLRRRKKEKDGKCRGPQRDYSESCTDSSSVPSVEVLDESLATPSSLSSKHENFKGPSFPYRCNIEHTKKNQIFTRHQRRKVQTNQKDRHRRISLDSSFRSPACADDRGNPKQQSDLEESSQTNLVQSTESLNVQRSSHSERPMKKQSRNTQIPLSADVGIISKNFMDDATQLYISSVRSSTTGISTRERSSSWTDSLQRAEHMLGIGSDLPSGLDDGNNLGNEEGDEWLDGFLNEGYHNEEGHEWLDGFLNEGYHKREKQPKKKLDCTCLAKFDRTEKEEDQYSGLGDLSTNALERQQQQEQDPDCGPEKEFLQVTLLSTRRHGLEQSADRNMTMALGSRKANSRRYKRGKQATTSDQILMKPELKRTVSF